MRKQGRTWKLATLPAKVLVDSVVVIAYLDSRNFHHTVANPVLTSLLKRRLASDCRIFYNPIVEAESWPGVQRSVERNRLAILLSTMERLDLDPNTARRGGDLAKLLLDGIRRKHGNHAKLFGKRDRFTGEWRPDWKLGDALIAASAEREGAAIITNNVDFEFLRTALPTVDIIQFPDIEV